MSLDNKIITRRDFLNGAAALTASGLLAPISAFAADARQTIVIPVVKDMTGNLVMGYIAEQAGLDLGKHVTDDARNYMTLTFGEKSPKTIWVGMNLDNVVLSDQIAWRTTEAGVKPFSKKMKVERTPKNLDYLFSGDSLVLDLSKMNEADRAKVIAKFGDKSVNIARKELLGYAEKAYGGRVKQQKTAIAKLKDIDPKRVERYTNMDTLEFMVRAVEPGVGDSMYEGLKEQGVKFESPVGYTKALEVATEPVNHRDAVKVGDIMVYFGIGYNRPGDTPGNIGFSAKSRTSAHLRYVGSLDELKSAIGASAYNEAWKERLPERTTTESSTTFATTDAWDRAYAPIDLGPFRKLVEKHILIRAGNVVNDLNPLTYMQERGYNFRRAGVQIVDPSVAKKG
ncbi:twin-arginine translocation signal domain-containing protein [Candidatus Woesearchaeota archaeon]|nr:twin-arginine translocation signal domain-containing protein [Candidatus Woesearchaeota archaeon]